MSFWNEYVFLPGLDKSYSSHKRALVRRNVSGRQQKKAQKTSSATACDSGATSAQRTDEAERERAIVLVGSKHEIHGSPESAVARSEHAGPRIQDHKATDNYGSRLLLTPTSQHVHRMQMWSVCLGYYLPKARDRSLDTHSWLETLPEVIGSSALLQAASDVLADSFLGELFQRQDLRVKAAENYGCVLAGLQKILAVPLSVRVRKDAVLASLLLLAWAETYIMKLPYGDESRRVARSMHLTAAEAYLDISGPEISQTRLGRQMSFVLCNFARMKGSTGRKAASFRLDSHVRFGEEPRDQAMATLSRITLQIPALLEATDNFLRSHQQIGGNSLVLQLWLARSTLQQWDFKHYREPAFMRVPLTRAYPLAGKTDESFPHIYVFDSVQIRKQYSIYWSALLAINVALLDLLEYDCKLQGCLPHDQSLQHVHRDLVAEAYQCAADCVRIHPHSNERDWVTATPVGPDVTSMVGHVFDRYGGVEGQRLVEALTRNTETGAVSKAQGQMQTPQELLASRAYELRIRERAMLNPVCGVMPNARATSTD